MLKSKLERTPRYLALYFFLGSISMSSFFHGDSLYRVPLQLLALSTFILFAFHSGKKVLTLAALTLPAFILLGVLSKNETLPHLLILTVISFSLVLHKEIIPIYSTFRSIWKAVIFAISIVYLMHLAGITSNNQFSISTSGVVKNSIGFFNPNAAALLAAGALMAASFSRSKSRLAISIAAFTFVMLETLSRTSFMLVVVFSMAAFLAWLLPSMAVRIASAFVYVLCATTIAAIIYVSLDEGIQASDQYMYIDEFISMRLSTSMPRISASMLFMPDIGGKSVEFAWANLIMNFGAIVAFTITTLGILVSFRVSNDLLKIYFIGSVLYFSSLFVENIAYSYLFAGLLAFMPTALILLYVAQDSIKASSSSGDVIHDSGS